MRQYLLLLLLLGLGIWGYLYYFRAEEPPKPPPRHLAPEGTFFVLGYVSTPTNHGIVGFEPGRQVHFVRADRPKGSLVVSDGQYEIEVKPNQLTNDLDIAALARNGDQASQQRIQTFIDQERSVYETNKRQEELRYAQEVERLNRGGQPAAGPNGLPALGNNPYSYLSAPPATPH